MNIIVRLLLDLGILKPTEGDWKEIKAQDKAIEKISEKERFEQADYSHDPIVAPRRYQESDDFNIGWRTLIPLVVVGVSVLALLTWASDEWVWSDETPEKKLRAEWVNKTRSMSCIDLKKIVDECYWRDTERCDQSIPSVGVQFSYWEYMGNERFYPSPRPDNECIEETGHPRVVVTKCERMRSAILGCPEYEYPRDESTMTITFPEGWHYTDPWTEQDYTDPNEFMSVYHPDLASQWKGVVNGT